MVMFDCDPDFCPKCGSILVVPKKGDSAKCDVCSNLILYTKFENIYYVSTMTFNEDVTPNKSINLSPNTKDNRMNAHLGPIIDRKCAKCSCEKMSYSTMQTRSADEGQTVFYTCIECAHKEIEYA